MIYAGGRILKGLFDTPPCVRSQKSAASQRFLVVRNYYMTITDDPDARLQAYAMDTLAQSYLGEFYATLYDLLASYC